MKNDFLQNIRRLLTRRVIYHATSWFVLLCILTISEMRGGTASFGHNFSNELINVFFYAAIYYINSEILIPKYLIPNRLWTYLGLLFGLAMFLTPIKIFVLFLKFQNYTTARYTQVATNLLRRVESPLDRLMGIKKDDEPQK